MSSLKKSINSKFNDLEIAIRQEKGKLPSSQGVNAYIVVYPPSQEQEYLNRVKKDYSEEHIIDISKLFVDFIDKYGKEYGGSYGLDFFLETYKNNRSTTDQVFIDENSEEKDLFSLILDNLKKAKNKIPILIRTGILYGTGIKNNNILETKVVGKMKKPLIIFYPGTIKEDMDGKEVIYFLGEKKASDYRGQFI